MQTFLLTVFALGMIASLASHAGEDIPRPAIGGDWITVKAERFAENPLIHPGTPGLDWKNINGPTVIRAPEWVKKPLATYYMYFANHRGKSIKLALADDLHGPWTIHEEDVLRLKDTPARGHIASPDIMIDNEAKQVRMYYHGNGKKGQDTYLALSEDGLRFEAKDDVMADDVYLRVFEHKKVFYGIVDLKGSAVGAGLYRSKDGLKPFESGPRTVIPWARHSSVLVKDRSLYVFFSRIGDAPEQILLTKLTMKNDWTTWAETAPETAAPVLKPETEYEGAQYPVKPSTTGPKEHVNQLRDPFVFEEGGRYYLFYTVAGECGIAAAELTFSPSLK